MDHGNGIIYNGDVVKPQKKLKEDTLKSVQDSSLWNQPPKSNSYWKYGGWDTHMMLGTMSTNIQDVQK